MHDQWSLLASNGIKITRESSSAVTYECKECGFITWRLTSAIAHIYQNNPVNIDGQEGKPMP